MIPLLMRAQIEGAADRDFILRVADSGSPSGSNATWSSREIATLDGESMRIRLPSDVHGQMVGDILLISPRARTARRLLRASSQQNFLLVTEQCDQLCVMCSQPPKKTHRDQFGLFEEAVLLAPHGMRITITGGEPTLHKERLLELLQRAADERPDLHFHTLTNAQHFAVDDIAALRTLKRTCSWGVPLYSADAAVHDQIVGKSGAFHLLENGLSILGSAGASVELRTVVMTQTIGGLEDTASFVARNLSFVELWAIMQLENIGFAKSRWSELFVDTSEDFRPIASAVEIARAAGVEALLYNFPLCTVDRHFRGLAPSTISDWKRKYVDVCDGCSARDGACGGFFEWYPTANGYRTLRPM